VLNLNFMLSSSVSSKLLIIPPNIHAPWYAVQQLSYYNYGQIF
jgi:hypothetical protein